MWAASSTRRLCGSSRRRAAFVRSDAEGALVPGIFVTKKEARGAVYPLIRASVHTPGGRQRTLTRSVGRRSTEDALREVVDFRYHEMKAVHGDDFPYGSADEVRDEEETPAELVALSGTNRGQFPGGWFADPAEIASAVVFLAVFLLLVAATLFSCAYLAMEHEALVRRVLHQEVILKGAGRVREAVPGPDGAIYVVLNAPSRVVRLHHAADHTARGD